MTTEPTAAEELNPAALKALLRPLVKLLISKGLPAPALYDLVKEIYVEVAAEAFRLDGAPPTDSRVSMLTGIHRKSVRSLRQAEAPDDGGLARRVSVLSTVVGRWLADPELCDAEGQPMSLPRHAETGPSFDRLVEAVSRDVRPRTVLDELQRRGAVRLDPDERVTLLGEALLPSDAEAERMHFLARNLTDHLAAAVANVLREEGPPPFLERAIFYNNLQTESVDDLEERARVLSAELLNDLNRLAFAKQAEDRDRPDKTRSANERFRFGVFFYREDEGEAETTANGGGDDERQDDQT
ncbi:MAG: DUF6502 family protein [Pseudomonadota bacterium]